MSIEQIEIAALPDHFDGRSRLWFYTADRDLTAGEAAFLKEKLAAFLPSWTAHNRHLKAAGALFFDRILMLAVDETQAGVSGCGIDKSVHFVEDLGRELGIDWFDRMLVGFQKEDGSVGFLPVGQFAEKVKSGVLSKETTVVDTLVSSKSDFETGFFKPAQSTWLRRFL